MLQKQLLAPDNFKDFLFLLEERGKCNKDFYTWKYQNNKNTGGIIYYNDDRPVACIGFIKRESCKRHEQLLWYADWFVDESMRGKGLGVNLLQDIQAHADLVMGIPSNPNAQKVAAKAGYTILNDWIEATAILRPFHFGQNRYPFKFFMRYLRGIQFMFKYLNIDLFTAPHGKIDNEISIDDWVNASKENLKEGCFLSRNYEFIDNVLNNPNFKNYSRWTIKNSSFYAVGIVREKNALKNAIVLDLFVREEYFKQAYLILAKTLYNAGFDSFNFIIQKKYIEKNRLFKGFADALHISFSDVSNCDLDYVSHLDKESTWIY